MKTFLENVLEMFLKSFKNVYFLLEMFFYNILIMFFKNISEER